MNYGSNQCAKQLQKKVIKNTATPYTEKRFNSYSTMSPRNLLLSSAFLLFLSSPLTVTANANNGDLYTATPISQQSAGRTIAKPSRGMNMTQVEAKFGSPTQNLAPTGTPPIARWIYDGFTVYFEHQHVIHAVKHR